MRPYYPMREDSIGWPGPGAGGPSSVAKQRAGIAPVQGMPVNISGPQALSSFTDSAGCAFFGSLSSGTYGISAQLSGYTTTGWNVDPSDGISPTGTAISDSVVPTAGSTTVKTYLYDKAATVNVTVNTKLWDNTIQNEQ